MPKESVTYSLGGLALIDLVENIVFAIILYPY